MKKIKLMFAAVFILLLQVTVYGQSGKYEEQLVKNLSSVKTSETAAKENLVTKAQIYQTGNANHTSISQRNASSKPNGAFIEQVGIYNSVFLHQQGVGNKLNATQTGSHNSYSGDIDGIGNSSAVMQKGTRNEINQTVKGRYLDYTLIQIGNNNSINQVETSSSSKPYKVVQQGNNMNIRIEQSNVGLPTPTGKRQ
ncbi:hypothetical protein [Pontibacter sp. H249]|uniref:hypothetical protein n=1 Tax=Pontibacter sp. H249 TaxID=3133420 RepID=UPI0030BF433A